MIAMVMSKLASNRGLSLLFSSVAALSAPQNEDQFYENKIRPILVSRCGSCHGAKAKMGGLVLTDKSSALQVITAGRVADSKLIQVVRYEGKVKMPPTGKLAEAEIASLEQWVAKGAQWPDETKSKLTVADATFWAFQPVTKPEAPRVQQESWAQGPIDRFILERLETKSLTLSQDEGKSTLLRRVTLDLTGLLPTPAEIEVFLKDESHEAFQNVVDRLLASPDFGVRWGRHWLDLTYWAETTGVGRRVPLRNAWRYRDYVIDAFNKDKPYNQIIQEQLAGDVPKSDISKEDDQFTPGNRNVRSERLVATGFLVLGPWALFNQDKTQLRMDVADLQADKVTRVFLGLTIGCARCHDHKFDPISSRDYYAVAGIFANTRTLVNSMPGQSWSGINERPIGFTKTQVRQFADEVENWEKQLAQAQADEETAKQQQVLLKNELKDIKASKIYSAAEVTRIQDEIRAAAKKIAAASHLVQYLTFMQPTLPQTHAAEENSIPEDLHINLRGNAHALGEVVPRGFIKAAMWEAAPLIPSKSSGRRELAEWIADARNPLTARVYVNRLWQHLMGAGIVASVDNFGSRGDRPTHPELLDYLASRLVENGWSTKKMIREIVLSHTYRVSSESNPRNAELDPGNQLLWRASRIRLDAEEIRDSVLQVSGRLSFERGGPALPLTLKNVNTIAPYFLEDNAIIGDDVKFRRTAYQPIMRGSQMEGVDILNLFDFADPDQVVGIRNATTVPTQSLYLLNSPFFKEESRKFADRILSESTSIEDRVSRVHRLALNRVASKDDIDQAKQFLSDFEGSLRKQSPLAKSVDSEVWTRYCHAILVSAEFLYRR